MIQFGKPVPDDAANQWRYELDQFVQENQQELAALVWGLSQEWGRDSQDVLGIDLKPHPHFVCCSRTALETFNQKVDYKIQEILGIVDGHNPEEEVVIIAIGEGIKLINFQPDLSPSECFQKFSQDLDSLIKILEEEMSKTLSRIQQ
jgi:hypothetical protein